MWNFIYKASQRYENKIICDVTTNTKYTYKEFFDKAIFLGNMLQTKIPSKVRCGVYCQNNLNMAIAIMACWKADIIPVPIATEYGQLKRDKIIAKLELSLVLTDYEITDLENRLIVVNVNAEHINLNKVFNDDDKIFEDVALVMCTSGTTGDPKGVMLSYKAVIKNVDGILAYFDIRQQDTIFIIRTLFHAAVLVGEFLVSLIKGLNILFLSEGYNPMKIKFYTQKYGVSVMCGTPTLFFHIAMLYKRKEELSNLRLISLSGECLKKSVAEIIRKIFSKAEIYNVYGLTENSPRVSYLEPRLFDKKIGSVGKGLIGTKIYIIDDEGKVLNPNERGQIVIKSESIMAGYYKDISETNKRINQGVLRTGDWGYLDENGDLYVLGRMDGMIIKAGMNIYPKEIEEIIEELPLTKECVAYGRKTNTTELICINIVLNQEYNHYSQKELFKEFSKVLPQYMMPEKIEICKELKRGESGKVIRQE